MLNEYAPLTGIRRVDAVIVGGGLTGLITGEMLSSKGLRVIVLEAGSIGQGASGLCSGVATLQAAPVYERIVALHGHEAAQQHVHILQALLSALPDWLTSLTPHRSTDAYTYAFLPRDLPALEEQFRLCESLGLPVSIAPDAGGCPFPVELSMLLPEQVMLEVEPLMDALIHRIRASGGQVYGQSRVTELAEGRVYTADARVDAPCIILAAGKPLGVKRPHMLALLESRTLISCHLTSQVPLHTCQQSVRPDGLSLRPIPGGAVVSWCAGRSGARSQAERLGLFQRVICGRLKDWEAEQPQFRQDVWSLDGLPVIGALPEYRGRVLCATGYSGFGILGAMLSARVLTRHLLGRATAEDRMYAPDRALPRKASRQAMTHLARLRAAESLRRRAPACSLCGCRLRYNVESIRWECPSCGSGYGMLGNVLNSPAMHSAQISALQRPDL